MLDTSLKLPQWDATPPDANYVCVCVYAASKGCAASAGYARAAVRCLALPAADGDDIKKKPKVFAADVELISNTSGRGAGRGASVGRRQRQRGSRRWSAATTGRRP